MSVALLGAAYAQPARAASESPGASGTDASICSRDVKGSTPYQAKPGWTKYLLGCLTANRTTLYLVNISPYLADVFIVWTVNPTADSFRVAPLSGTHPNDLADQAADVAVARQFTSSRAVFAPHEAAVIQASSGTLNLGDLRFDHDRIATVVDVMARALVRAGSDFHWSTIPSEKADEIRTCFGYIRKVLDGSVRLAPSPGETWRKWVSSTWQNYEGQAACGKVSEYFTGEPAEPHDSWFNKVLLDLEGYERDHVPSWGTLEEIFGKIG